MAKGNTGGGKKYKSTKKRFGPTNKNTVLKVEGQSYAKITDALGSGRFRCVLGNGSKVLGILSGNMKKRRIWVNRDDLVLVGMRDFEMDKVDIISKYERDEYTYLKNIEHCLEMLIGNTKDENDTDFNHDDITHGTDFNHDDITHGTDFTEENSNNSDNSDNSDSDDNLDIDNI